MNKMNYPLHLVNLVNLLSKFVSRNRLLLTFYTSDSIYLLQIV